MTTCKCPKGWCYERRDCRRRVVDQTDYPLARTALAALRLGQLTERRAALADGENPNNSAAAHQAAIDALDRAIAALSG